jgi:hypothetical protein
VTDEAGVPNSAGGVESLEERYAVGVSLLLNLPAYVSACTTMMFFRPGETHVSDLFAGILAWSTILAPFLVASAIAHAVWAGRVRRVGKRALAFIRGATVLGVIATATGIAAILIAFGV